MSCGRELLYEWRRRRREARFVEAEVILLSGSVKRRVARRDEIVHSVSRESDIDRDVDLLILTGYSGCYPGEKDVKCVELHHTDNVHIVSCV